MQMTAEKWDLVKELFRDALSFPDVQRSDFLSRACGDDEELKREVEKLLDSYQENDSFLETSAIADWASFFGEDLGDLDLETSEPPPPRFTAGTVLNGRYEIVRLLGRGGMGEVYLASDTRINRKVALKVLHPDLASSKESLRRFTLESQAVSALNHPHIMTIYEVDRTNDDTLFFVAEHVDGLTLNHLIQPGLDLEKALDIAMQVASALSAAHEAGITHRDIKPENIIVRRDGYVKVLDFGLAKLTRRQAASTSAGSENPTEALQRTRPGSVMGTAAYMSPEQARGLAVDGRADIWSLGAVIYEMLTRCRPFSGETRADIIVSVLSKEPPPLSAYALDLPPELEWILTKALSRNVEARYETAKAMRADLERCRKRIEFDRNLKRSGGATFSDEVPDNAKTLLVENAFPTAGGETRPPGAASELGDRQSFWSAPSFEAVVRQAKTHKVSSVILTLALVTLLWSAIYFMFVRPARNAQIDSIAVLPFENTSKNPELAYVADGLSESLIDRLSQLPHLKVISRNSSFQFRDPNVNVQDVASKLGVRAIVTGSVTQVGDDLNIRIDIVDAIENRHLAGGQYRRKAGDILTIQREIAQTAAEQLRLKLTDPQSRRFAANDTENSEAYRYYLNGLVELNGPQDVRSRALEYFERAISLDPNFAAAHTEIAWVYWSRANGSSDPNELMPKAKAAVERALSSDPDNAKAHAVTAMVNEYEFAWADAEKEYQRAIELNPNLDFARNNYAFFLSVMGRQNEALAQLEQQSLRDPLNRRLALLHKAIVLTQGRSFDAALQAYQEAQTLEPAREVPNFSLAYAYAGKGFYNEAAGYYKKSVERLGGDENYSQPLVYLAATYARIPGKQSEARAIVSKIESKGGYASPALLAAVYVALNENDKAMELLEQAYIKRDLLLRFIGTGYEYDGLRGDPRFADLLKRIGLAH